MRSTAPGARGVAIVLAAACAGTSGEPGESTTAWETRAPVPEPAPR